VILLIPIPSQQHLVVFDEAVMSVGMLHSIIQIIIRPYTLGCMWSPELHMELGAPLAFEKAIRPSSHLSTSPPSNYRSGGICSYNFHGSVTYQSVRIVLLNQGVGMHGNHASFVYL
jgi:hypothetical protein